MSAVQLYFGDSFPDDDGDDDGVFDPASDASSLPFPKPLDRSSFLTPTFSAADFLSTLTTRFQTLEDLQSELQDLLKSLNKELVDLVNDNYTSFLSLGQKLSGGEERIEEVRVGLLGFQRDIAGVRDHIDARSQEVKVLLEEKKRLRKGIQSGRALLELEESLVELERRLSLATASIGNDVSDSIDDEVEELGAVRNFREWTDDWTHDDADLTLSDEENDSVADPPDLPGSVRKSIQQFLAAQQMLERCGHRHPFIQAQRERVETISDILDRALDAAIRAQNDVHAKQRLIRLKSQIENHQ